MAAGLSEADVQECALLFKLFDADKSNTIDINEFSTLCRGMGAIVTNARLTAIFEQSDSDKSGALSLEQLQSAYKTIKDEEATDELLVELSKIFRTLDTEQKGYLDSEEFKKLLQSKGEPLSDDEVAEMFKNADTSGDGKIDLDEFLVMNGVDPPAKPEAEGEGLVAAAVESAEAAAAAVAEGAEAAATAVKEGAEAAATAVAEGAEAAATAVTEAVAGETAAEGDAAEKRASVKEGDAAEKPAEGEKAADGEAAEKKEGDAAETKEGDG
eukprot:TRINITY_DN2470_c0_g1_i2.p1 TRINITY_DN2470_c0_g1~~TRINITY_DN2470_c0_g1_i2.p1  ORF type:complete len:270 (-),score=85.40 TRINITY_DN2470_c0_g1_i2:377-1186(-)